MKNFLFYFALFFMYSVLGYILECSFISLKKRKFVFNRGFLIGPYLPIYGWGSIIIVLTMNKYLDDFILLFIMSSLISTFLEYLTSFIMEKFFKARWWDYSSYKFNINGRVCLLNSTLFGIVGLLIMYFINPLFVNILNSLNETFFIVLFSILFVIYLMDTILSIYITYRLRCDAKDIKIDITNEIKDVINKNRFFKLRVLKAYPRLKDNNNYKLIKDILDKVNNLKI